MGVSFRFARTFSILAVASLLPAVVFAQDQIIQNNGSVISGQITGVSDGEVTVTTTTSNGGQATTPVHLSDIKSVVMPAPADLAAASGLSPAEVVAKLEPLVKAYAGLPTNWVVDAMSQLADAYSDLKQNDKAAAEYAQINQLYPGSAYTDIATAGQAKLLLEQGKIDEAAAKLQPIITEADKTVSPSADDARAYAAAFLVHGQILEAQKKYPEALEALLTVKTVFYQNQALVDQSDEMVKNLRAQDPGVSVN